ncbi:MAG: hypothetical protein AB7G37_18350 [Solirubrobacteraceae bacterium]
MHATEAPPLHLDRDAAVGLIPLLGALLGALAVWVVGLREFAFSDYEVEAMPAVDLLRDGQISAFLTELPGYAGAVMLQAPFGLLGGALGGDTDLWTWRFQALPGLALLTAIGALLGTRVARRLGKSPRGLALGAVAAALISGSPFAVLAQQTGHPEELLVTGLCVAAVLLAINRRPALAGALIGVAAVAKPWAVIAVPVVLLGAHDRRALLRTGTALVIAGGLLFAPTFINNGADRAVAGAHASTSGIFKPYNVFWFAGAPNPDWPLDIRTSELFENDPTKASWAQRLEPAWAARISHPLIVLFAGVLAALYGWRRRGRDGQGTDLLLLLATVAWWRCLLDTWNIHYYALAAVVALGAWEAWRGRVPLFTLTVTASAWINLQLISVPQTSPSLSTAIYLAWALPLGVIMVVRLLAPGLVARFTAPAGAWLRRQLPTLAGANVTPRSATDVR